VVMKNSNINDLGMASHAVYQIAVKGVLDEHWTDWFNGTLLKVELERGGWSQTTLTCRVRDQAELLGILNRLNSLNLPLVQAVWINRDPEP